jgi:acyl-coenzyme A thioesterase PaaI-like protein
VKLAGTAGIRVEQMSGSKAVVSLKNKFRVQNHIGGIHACGMALVGESATGIVVGMNVPDNAIPLCKSMNIKFVKRCEGGSCFPEIRNDR